MVLKEFCNQWVGVPFRHAGRDREGVDCWGLVIEYLKGFGIDAPDMEYTEQWARAGANHFSERICQFPDIFKPVDRGSVGDLVFMRGVNGVVDHAGILVGNNKFIHSIRDIGVAISDLSGAYKRKLHGFYRIKHG